MTTGIAMGGNVSFGASGIPPLTARDFDFNAEVERVAKLMCAELGLDPDAIVQIPYGDDQHLGERYYPNLPPMTEYARWPDGTMAAERTVRTPATGVPRWVSMRPHAALAIAGWRAVNKFVLTEK